MNDEEAKAKTRYLDEWIEAVNAHGGFGTWHAAVTRHPGEIRDVLMLLSGEVIH